MRPFLVAFIGASLVLGTACSREPEDPRERLLGTWSLELDPTFGVDPELSKLSTRNRLAVYRLAGDFLESLRFKFSKDGQLLTTAGKHKVRSHYRIDRADEGSLVLTVTDSRPNALRPTEQVQIVFADDQMQLARGNQTLILSRH